MRTHLIKKYKIAAVELTRWVDSAPDVELDDWYPRDKSLDTRKSRASVHEPPLGEVDASAPTERVPALAYHDNSVIQYQMEEIFKWYVSGGFHNNRQTTPNLMAELLGLSVPRFKEYLASVQNKMGMMFKGAKILDKAAELAEMSLFMALEERALAIGLFHDLNAAGDYKSATSALSAASAARRGTLDKYTEVALKNTAETQDNNVTIVLPAFLTRKSAEAGMDSGTMTARYNPETKRSDLTVEYPDHEEDSIDDAIETTAEAV